MFYKNARIYCSDFQFRNGAFEVRDGSFGEILSETVPEDAIDLQGATVIPGLIDIHNHGNSGADMNDGDYEGLKRMAKYLAENGITSFTPATSTMPYDRLEKAFATAKRFCDKAPAGHARLLGIHMEGPYFSEKKKGGQNSDYLKDPDFEGFKKLYDGCDGLVRIVDVAPELPGAEEFITKASKLCTVSVAHTDTDYDTAKMAFNGGATLLTHLYNGMTGIHHRNPGVIPAAVENSHVRAELIGDGIHVHPAAVRLAFTMFGKERIVLISDAIRCCGLEEGGEFDAGCQRAWLIDGVGRLADGTITGAATNLFDGMVRVIRMGIREEDAIRAATYNPACAIGAANIVGSIAPGKQADFVICGGDYSCKQVYILGERV